METKDHNVGKMEPWQIALLSIAPFALVIIAKAVIYLVRKKCYKNKTAPSPTNEFPNSKVPPGVPTHVFGSSTG